MEYSDEGLLFFLLKFHMQKTNFLFGLCFARFKDAFNDTHVIIMLDNLVVSENKHVNMIPYPLFRAYFTMV